MKSAIALTRYFTGTFAWNHERASRFCLRLLQKNGAEAVPFFVASFNNMFSYVSGNSSSSHTCHAPAALCMCLVLLTFSLAGLHSAACSISPSSSHLFLQRLSVLVQCENAFDRLVASSSRRLLICRDWTWTYDVSTRKKVSPLPCKTEAALCPRTSRRHPTPMSLLVLMLVFPPLKCEILFLLVTHSTAPLSTTTSSVTRLPLSDSSNTYIGFSVWSTSSRPVYQFKQVLTTRDLWIA